MTEIGLYHQPNIATLGPPLYGCDIISSHDSLLTVIISKILFSLNIRQSDWFVVDPCCWRLGRIRPATVRASSMNHETQR